MLLYGDHYIVIFGGIQEITREKDDVTAFNLKTNKWITLQIESSFNRSISPLKKLVYPNESNKSTIKQADKVKSPTLQSKRKNSIQKNANIQSNHSNSDLRPTYNPANNTNITREAMKNSILALNYKRGTGTKQDDNKKSPNHAESTILESLNLPSIMHIVPPNGKVAGHRPCARDGHSASIYKGRIVIFGGDRHKMSFNDIYLFNLDKAIRDSEEKT